MGNALLQSEAERRGDREVGGGGCPQPESDNGAVRERDVGCVGAEDEEETDVGEEDGGGEGEEDKGGGEGVEEDATLWRGDELWRKKGERERRRERRESRRTAAARTIKKPWHTASVSPMRTGSTLLCAGPARRSALERSCETVKRWV
jgi:hypothetical protein